MKTIALPLFALAFLSASQSFALGVGDSAPTVSENDIQIDDSVVSENILTLAPGTRFVLLEFFQTTCDVCAANLPILSQLAQDIKATTTTRLVGADRDAAAIQTYVDTNRNLIQFPTVVDSGRAATSGYGVTETPTTFILDANGTVIYTHVGAYDDDDLAQIKGLVK